MSSLQATPSPSTLGQTQVAPREASPTTHANGDSDLALTPQDETSSHIEAAQSELTKAIPQAASSTDQPKEPTDQALSSQDEAALPLETSQSLATSQAASSTAKEHSDVDRGFIGKKELVGNGSHIDKIPRQAIHITPYRLKHLEKKLRCDMDECFNKARCKSLTVYFYPCEAEGHCFSVFNFFRPGDEIPTASTGEIWRVTGDPKEACLFIMMGSQHPKHPTSQASWQHYQERIAKEDLSFMAAGGPGANHVFISLSDWGVWSKFPNLIQATSSASSHRGTHQGHDEEYFKQWDSYRKTRVGFDIAFPHLPLSITNSSYCLKTNDNQCSSFALKSRDMKSKRSNLAFFRGQRTSDLRGLLYRYNQVGRGISIVEVQEDARTKVSHGMLSSKFALAPEGQGFGQPFRLIEAMSAGAVPVYLGQSMIPPFAETLNFSDYGLYEKMDATRINGTTVHLKILMQTMHNMSKVCISNTSRCELRRLQANSIWVFEHYMATSTRAVAGLLEVFSRRFQDATFPVETVGGYFQAKPNFCEKMAKLETDLAGRGNPPPKGGFPVDRDCDHPLASQDVSESLQATSSPPIEGESKTIARTESPTRTDDHTFESPTTEELQSATPRPREATSENQATSEPAQTPTTSRPSSLPKQAGAKGHSENATHRRDQSNVPQASFVLRHPAHIEPAKLKLLEKNLRCDMGQCFNEARCKSPTVYIYPCEAADRSHCFPVFNFFRPGDEIPTASTGEIWRVTSDPKEACVFIMMGSHPKSHASWQDYQEKIAGEPSFMAAGVEGKNHVFISVSGGWGVWSRYPALIQASSSASYFRGVHQNHDDEYLKRWDSYRKTRIGFDIAFPHLPLSITNSSYCKGDEKDCRTFKVQHRDVQAERPNLAFFRGMRTSDLRGYLYPFHNERHGIIAQEKEVKGPGTRLTFATGMLTSKFVLAPEADGFGQTSRLIEAMSAGAVPVYLGQSMIPPFAETLNFSEYGIYGQISFKGPNSTRNSLGKVFRDLQSSACSGNVTGEGGCEWKRLQANSIWVFEHYMATTARAVAGLLEVFSRRFQGATSPVETAGGYFKAKPNFCEKILKLETDLEARGNPPPKGGFPVDRECKLS